MTMTPWPDPDNLICDICNKPADELTQHCHMSPFIGRAHMLCDECLEEFPVPTLEERRALNRGLPKQFLDD